MASRIPDEVTFEWFQKNRNGLIRNLMRYADQHKGARIISQEGKIVPGQYSHESKDVLYDLREKEVTAEPAPIQPPVLSLTVDQDDEELDLDWTLPETYDGLFLEKSEDGETWTPLITLPGTQDAYEDADVEAGTVYYYRIRGQVGGAYSVYSNVVSGQLEAVAVAFALLGTGKNSDYQLGTGGTSNTNTFAVLAVPTFAKIAAGLWHSMAVASDGTLWGCGKNQYGQCGNGSTSQITTWVQIGVADDWADVKCGSEFTLATKVDGTVYTWGRNNLGQLGLGDNTNRSSPVQVGSGSTWIFANAGEFNVLLVKNDNTLWMAGWNTQNQIGDGTATNRNALTQTTGSGFAKAYAFRDFAFGIKTDGTLHAWGANNYGQLGIGSGFGNFDSPQAVGSDTNWKSVSGGESFAIATKTNGTIWATGEVLSGGELGLGATTDTGTVFVQIGSDTNWDYTTSGPASTLALKTTGAVFGWGWNGNGALGTGDFTTRTTPTQESTAATTFTAVANANGYHGLALQTV